MLFQLKYNLRKKRKIISFFKVAIHDLLHIKNGPEVCFFQNYIYLCTRFEALWTPGGQESPILLSYIRI